MMCPISHMIMDDPVVADDGHSYERKSILAWFAHRGVPVYNGMYSMYGANMAVSPMTNMHMSTRLVSNISLKSLIQSHKKAVAARKAMPSASTTAPTVSKGIQKKPVAPRKAV